MPSPSTHDLTVLRPPVAEDGPAVSRLIQASGALDANSLYCTLLQCTDFAQTCVLAEAEGRLQGWLSAYVPPAQPDCLFVWQVCTAPQARGRGLGRRMIRAALDRPANRHLSQVGCTITEGNAASWALFRGVARSLDAPVTTGPRFDHRLHLDGRGDSELQVEIGPFTNRGLP